MNGADVDCATIARLRWRWLDGEFDPADREAYEQHLLYCPPCLALTVNSRTALRALANVAQTDPAPPADLIERLVTAGPASSGGGA